MVEQKPSTRSAWNRQLVFSPVTETRKSKPKIVCLRSGLRLSTIRSLLSRSKSAQRPQHAASAIGNFSSTKVPVTPCYRLNSTSTIQGLTTKTPMMSSTVHPRSKPIRSTIVDSEPSMNENRQCRCSGRCSYPSSHICMIRGIVHECRVELLAQSDLKQLTRCRKDAQ